MSIRKKATFSLKWILLQQAKELVDEGVYKSLNQFIETALQKAVDEEKKKKAIADLKEASKDRLFLDDIHSTMKDFSHVDVETLEVEQ